MFCDILPLSGIYYLCDVISATLPVWFDLCDLFPVWCDLYLCGVTYHYLCGVTCTYVV